MQQLQLASNEVCISSISAPNSYINDIQAAVDRSANGRQLGNDESRCLWSRRNRNIITKGAFWRWKGGYAQLDVLRMVINGCASSETVSQLTPLTMRVPILVMRPFRLSDRKEDSTRVDAFSEGASKAAHSSRPAFNDCSMSRSWTKSQSSSRAWDWACSWPSWTSSMGGQTADDMTKWAGNVFADKL